MTNPNDNHDNNHETEGYDIKAFRASTRRAALGTLLSFLIIASSVGYSAYHVYYTERSLKERQRIAEHLQDKAQKELAIAKQDTIAARTQFATVKMAIDNVKKQLKLEQDKCESSKQSLIELKKNIEVTNKQMSALKAENAKLEEDIRIKLTFLESIAEKNRSNIQSAAASNPEEAMQLPRYYIFVVDEKVYAKLTPFKDILIDKGGLITMSVSSTMPKTSEIRYSKGSKQEAEEIAKKLKVHYDVIVRIKPFTGNDSNVPRSFEIWLTGSNLKYRSGQ